MAVKVISANIAPTPVWHTRSGERKVLAIPQYLLFLHMKKDGKEMDAVVTFMQSFTCNGLSVPKKLRWFLPNWKEDGQLYNTAGAVHDWLYATNGNYGMFSRSECDDIFRGILRESGINRLHASAADFMLGLFGGGSSHWNSDEFGASVFAKLEIVDCWG